MRDVVESYAVLQIGRHSGFVGSIEYAGDIAAPAYGLECEGQAREAVHVRLGEAEGTQLREIQFAVVQGKTLREAYGELDRFAHVGMPELGDHGAILELHHRMDDGLGVHDDMDAVGLDVEEPFGFDDRSRW